VAPLIPGRRALVALLQVTTCTEVAARCGVAKSRVSEWASGLTTPSLEPRARLSQIYGISPSAWPRPSRPIAYARRRA